MRAPHTDYRGLSHQTAAARLRTDGPNELPRASQRHLLAVLADVLREPMLALLLAAGVVYLLLGDRLEAGALLVFACLSVGITVVQERRSERVLEALRDISSPRARVVRDGEVQRVAGREVVRGDLLLLAEGDRIPADALLLSGEGLLADESLLTGESVPVAKTPGSDRMFAGALLVRGEGLARVLATGQHSAIGRIGRSLERIETATPRLQAQTRRLVQMLGAAGMLVSVLALLLHGLLRGDWLQALLSAIALGMSMLPEELPVVLAVFTAMGAWRISQARVLTRRAAAIETLGAASVLCSDKTGTLTENRMSIVETWVAPGGDLARLLQAGRLASADKPVDPMERAFVARVPELPVGLQPVASRGPRARRPLMLRLWVEGAQLWPDAGARAQGAAQAKQVSEEETPAAAAVGTLRLVCKGAPEAVLALCRAPDGADTLANREAALAAAADMAGRGLRVLAVAEALDLPVAYAPPAVPGSGDAAPAIDALLDQPPPLRLLGLVALADPLRADVPAAIAQCRSAGLRVLMITGDHPGTARAIARAAGLADGDGGPPLTGDEIDRLSDPALLRRLKATTVCARIHPEQKLRIVQALQAQGEVVAMTGDGVNDAPALKAADIGIAMGGRGTDVAREAAALVLLGDDFGAIVAAVRLGRRIGDNLRKAVRFIFAVHVPVAGLALLPLLLDLPAVLGPLHIALLEMVIDPVCALAFEAEREEPDIMARPPRAADAPLLSAGELGYALLEGALALLMCGTLLVVATQRGLPADEARSLVFVTLVGAIFVLVAVNRRLGGGLTRALPQANRTLLVIAGLVTVTLATLLLWPAAARLLGFGRLHLHDLLLALAAGAALFVVLHGLKRA